MDGWRMVPRVGVEPTTFPLGGGRAIQLCHRGRNSLDKKLRLYGFAMLNLHVVPTRKGGAEGENRTLTMFP